MVPTRRRCSGPGCSMSGSFCSSRPTLRPLRTASCAAAIEDGRPIVSGSTTPGTAAVSNRQDDRCILGNDRMASISRGAGIVAHIPRRTFRSALPSEPISENFSVRHPLAAPIGQTEVASPES